MHNAPLPLRHFLLALAVVAVWGTNFVVIRIGLDHLPPLLFATLRFTLVLLPMAFFVKRPAVSWLNLAAYGVLIGAGQFGLLFVAMKGHISPGLASLVVQTQVFFTIGMAMQINREKVQGFQIVACCWPPRASC
jgi:O-acetylserine/cysteine efflux transporter